MTDGREHHRAPARGGSWIEDSLASVLKRSEQMQAEAERRQAEAAAEAEAHAATCSGTCERCQRFSCRCGILLVGSRSCANCDAEDARARLLKPTRDSVPAHFRWAIDATVDGLGVAGASGEARVQAPSELIRRGLSNPPSSGLLLLGPTGSGKTSLAVAMLDAWVRADAVNRTGALFVEAAWLARARARHRLGDGESPLVQEAISCPLLLLDDLGNEANDRDGCITDVVWGRTNHDRPLWITCGLASKEGTIKAFAEEIARKYDGGFARRIIETTKHVQLGRKA